MQAVRCTQYEYLRQDARFDALRAIRLYQDLLRRMNLTP